MKKIALVTCVAAKKPMPCAAKDLYQGELFENFMNVAKAHNPDEIYILSGKHHLLDLDTVIAPYDVNLNDVDDDALRAWADKVITQLKSVANLKNDCFILVASETYIKYLTPHLTSKTIPKGLVF